MNSTTIENQILSFVNSQIVDEQIEIKASDLFEEIGVDSQSIIQIVLFIERNFTITWQEKDLNKSNLKSVEALTQFVAHKYATK